MRMPETPRDLGYRMPAEWEPQSSVWLSWPNSHGQSFGHMVDEAEAAILSAADSIAQYVPVLIACADESAVNDVSRRTTVPGQVTPILIETIEPWCRDIAPTFLISSTDSSPLGAVDWTFRNWGGKYLPDDRRLISIDAEAGEKFAAHHSAAVFVPNIEFEGGAIESNGSGTILTTRDCILNANRNPDLSQSDAERLLQEFLGADHVVWVDGASIRGDDTDGHIDTTTRFTGPEQIVTSLEQRADHPNHDTLLSHYEQLCRARTANGGLFEVIPLPTPQNSRWCDVWETWLPLSYANFHVASTAIFVPAFDDPADDSAHEVLANCFSSHTVVPIDCQTIIEGLGGLHCLTQQVPATCRP